MSPVDMFEGTDADDADLRRAHRIVGELEAVFARHDIAVLLGVSPDGKPFLMALDDKIEVSNATYED